MSQPICIRCGSRSHSTREHDEGKVRSAHHDDDSNHSDDASCSDDDDNTNNNIICIRCGSRNHTTRDHDEGKIGTTIKRKKKKSKTHDPESERVLKSVLDLKIGKNDAEVCQVFEKVKVATREEENRLLFSDELVVSKLVSAIQSTKNPATLSILFAATCNICIENEAGQLEFATEAFRNAVLAASNHLNTTESAVLFFNVVTSICAGNYSASIDFVSDEVQKSMLRLAMKYANSAESVSEFLIAVITVNDMTRVFKSTVEVRDTIFHLSKFVDNASSAKWLFQAVADLCHTEKSIWLYSTTEFRDLLVQKISQFGDDDDECIQQFFRVVCAICRSDEGHHLFYTQETLNLLLRLIDKSRTIESVELWFKVLSSVAPFADRSLISSTAIRGKILAVAKRITSNESARAFYSLIWNITVEGENEGESDNPEERKLLFSTPEVRDSMLSVSRYATDRFCIDSFFSAVASICQGNPEGQRIFCTTQMANTFSLFLGQSAALDQSFSRHDTVSALRSLELTAANSDFKLNAFSSYKFVSALRDIVSKGEKDDDWRSAAVEDILLALESYIDYKVPPTNITSVAIPTETTQLVRYFIRMKKDENDAAIVQVCKTILRILEKIDSEHPAKTSFANNLFGQQLLNVLSSCKDPATLEMLLSVIYNLLIKEFNFRYCLERTVLLLDSTSFRDAAIAASEYMVTPATAELFFLIVGTMCSQDDYDQKRRSRALFSTREFRDAMLRAVKHVGNFDGSFLSAISQLCGLGFVENVDGKELFSTLEVRDAMTNVAKNLLLLQQRQEQQEDVVHIYSAIGNLCRNNPEAQRLFATPDCRDIFIRVLEIIQTWDHRAHLCKEIFPAISNLNITASKTSLNVYATPKFLKTLDDFKASVDDKDNRYYLQLDFLDDLRAVIDKHLKTNPAASVTPISLSSNGTAASPPASATSASSSSSSTGIAQQTVFAINTFDDLHQTVLSGTEIVVKQVGRVKEDIAKLTAAFESLHKNDKYSGAFYRGDPSSVVIFEDQILGSGAFSTVFLASMSDQKVAAKRLNPDSRRDAQQQADATAREAHMLITSKHPNVVQCFGVLVQKPYTYILLEKCECNISEYVAVLGNDLTMAHRVFLASSIALAISHLHSQKIIFCDLKPQNVLISNSGDCRLADFGSAVSTTSQTGSTLLMSGLTAAFAAPELRKAGQFPSFASDFYALGIVICEILSGEEFHPVESLSPEKFPSKNPLLLDLIKKCITKDPSARIPAANVATVLRKAILPSIAPQFVKVHEDELMKKLLLFREKKRNCGAAS